MLDYQRIVDDVRSLLCVQEADAMDFLRAAAADYSVACDEVNERLHQCASLLRQGLRSEAIHLAEIEPNLLDVTALLDFPERPQWDAMTSRCGIAAPTPLMIEAAAALNEAYALERPLSALLQQHRLLALARGPLTARIKVLRRLAALDANNPIWHEDLQTFEQERQKQIQEEVKVAAQAGDSDALASLDAELSSPDWKNPPPPALLKSAAEAKRALHYWAVQSQLEELATALTAARNSARLDLGRTLYNRWQETIASSAWQPHQQLAERAAPALQWVGENLEREAAETALAGAVDDERSATRLQELHSHAVKFGKLPPKLEERYFARLGKLQRAARLRRWLLGVGIAAGVAVAIILVGLGVSYQRYEGQVAAALKNLPFMLDHDQFEQAETLLKGLPERVARDPRVQKWNSQLQQKLKKEVSRKAEFAQKLGEVKQWQGQVLKSLDGEPGQNVLDRLRGELNHSREDLEQAAKLARTEEEHKAVDDAEKFTEQVYEQWQRQLDQAFQGQYDDFEKKLTQIERDNYSSCDALKSKLADLSANLERWVRTCTHVSLALQPRITTLKERLVALENKVGELERQDGDEKQITATVGNLAAYTKALQAFIERHPDSEATPDLKRAVDESLCWQAVFEWSELAGKINGTGITRLTPAAAQELTSLANVALENFSGCPECAGLAELLPYLKAIARRDNGGERIDAPLRKLFTAPLVKDVWMIEKENGKRYYVNEMPIAGRPFLYIVSFDGKTRGGNLISGEWEKAKVSYAPQVTVAEKIQPVLQALTDENWEPSFFKMLQAINADHSMDPILKANLLQQVLEAGIRGSYCLQKPFQRHLEWFNQQKINVFANWLDPTDSMVAMARSEAARKLNDFPDIVEPGRAAAEDSKTLRQRRLPEYRWVGWLNRARDGRWECLFSRQPKHNGRLMVVYRDGSGEKPRLVAVGSFQRGMIATIDAPPQSALLVAGRPLFLQVP
jgi:hypothetical protein